MSSFRPRALEKRGLLTETLPAEVPFVFSNNYLFTSTLPLKVRADTAAALKNVRRTVGSHTIPLTYRIKRGRESGRTLSIVHPHIQIKWAKFLDDFAETVISYCEKSAFSIRRPASIVSTFSEDPLDRVATPRDGIPHDLLLDRSMDYSNITSFFRYERYNLLGKFVDSDEFVRLEQRFPRLRILDVSKCFYNMYTHSVTWAVKDKGHAKKYKGSYTFESDFDRLMQQANYSETNGIVVGPELSRIFAEIILQELDKRVFSGLGSALRPDEDYAIRRYIDDFYIFAKTDEQLDCIQEQVSYQLEKFKLYLNHEKGQQFSRPFVTNLTLAKSALADVVRSTNTDVARAVKGDDVSELWRISSRVRRRVGRIREIVGSNKIAVSNVSGWLLAALRRELIALLAIYKDANLGEAREAVARILISVFGVAFYISSVDLRVRTSFSLTYLMLLVVREVATDPSDEAEWLRNFLFEQHIELTDAFWRELKRADADASSSIELSNLLTGGAYLFKEGFANHGLIVQILRWMASQELTYFSYVTQKYVMLRDKSAFGAELNALNAEVELHISVSRDTLGLETERFLIFSDYLSSPDVSLSTRLSKYRQVFGGSLSMAGCQELSRLVGYVDWEGIAMEHVLERHHLRPTYSAL